MDSDPQMQQAIYASIQSASPSRHSIEHSTRLTSSRSLPATGGDNFTRAVCPRTYRRRLSTGAHGYGHVDELRRSGIAPAVTNALENCKAKRNNNSRPCCKIRNPQVARNETSLGETPASETSGAVELSDSRPKTCASDRSAGLQESWSRIVGLGSYHTKECEGAFKGHVENTQEEICIIGPSHQPENSHDYKLRFEFRCNHAAPASGNVPAFDLVLASQADSSGSLNFTAIHVDCHDRFLSVHRSTAGNLTTLYRVPHRWE
ncbi:unnamed protein product [Ostreobium quekettii]|uniref:Uncharacterized protein n=1 Tax=Ostreobium quekettii TaxID=121088 RepID=A0A8S1JC50_9CHLO|nr:unnamed protein product [Ostreobium quekettii]